MKINEIQKNISRCHYDIDYWLPKSENTAKAKRHLERALKALDRDKEKK